MRTETLQADRVQLINLGVNHSFKCRLSGDIHTAIIALKITGCDLLW